MHAFNVVVERDSETGLYIGYVPGWPGAHTQGETREELHANLEEVIEVPLEDRDISPTLLRKIARDIGITVEELLVNR